LRDGLVLAFTRGMNEKAQALQERTHQFLIRVLGFCAHLPQNVATQRIAPQLIDSAGGTDSNYRAACRGRSKAEFIAKIGVAAEEADESKGWLSALLASNNAPSAEAEALIQEAEELTAIFVQSRKTAEARAKQDKACADAARRRRR
jgi:four helix bundle protein